MRQVSRVPCRRNPTLDIGYTPPPGTPVVPGLVTRRRNSCLNKPNCIVAKHFMHRQSIPPTGAAGCFSKAQHRSDRSRGPAFAARLVPVVTPVQPLY